jgi:hypothetical protein
MYSNLIDTETYLILLLILGKEMSENEKLQLLLHSLHSPYTNIHLHDPKKFPIFINDSYYLCLAEDWKNDGPQKVTLKGRESNE